MYGNLVAALESKVNVQMSGQVIFFIRHAHGEHNAVMEVALKAYYKAHPVSPSTAAAPTEFPSAAMGALALAACRRCAAGADQLGRLAGR